MSGNLLVGRCVPRVTLDRETRKRLARNAPHLRFVRPNERRVP